MNNTNNTHWIKSGRTLPPTPLSGMDLNSGYMPVRRVFYFSGAPDIAKLQSSLAKALAQWPDFSATVAMCKNCFSQDQLCLLRNDTGVRFTVETSDQAMPAFGINEPLGLPDTFCDAAICQTTGDDGPVFTVKIICFGDNDWTLATCNSHALCDGSGYWQFMQSWRDAFHDQALPTIDNQFMRYNSNTSTITVPAHLQIPAVPLFRQQMANTQHYRSAQILLPQTALDTIKNRINTALAPDWVSTQDVVMAMSWQCLARIALAEGMEGDQDFPLANVINIRPHLKLEHYVGNMAYSVSSHATLTDIAESPLKKLAQKIRQDAQQVSVQDMRAHLDFMQEALQQGHYNAGGYLTGFSLRIAEACVYGRGVMINNWSKFPAYAMDFSGTPRWFDLATSIPMHFVMAMPSPDGIVLRLFLPDTQLTEALTQLHGTLESIA